MKAVGDIIHSITKFNYFVILKYNNMKRIILLTSVLFTIILTTFSQTNQASADDSWNKFIEKLSMANSEFAKGIVGESTKEIWSHGDDVTLFGGYGAMIEPGWKSVESRLELAAKQNINGTYSSKQIMYKIYGDFAYLLQTEQYIFPGKAPLNFRVTMICKKEADGWKVVHRHGDMIKEPQN